MATPQVKWCFVPSCRNTSFNSPNKIFLCVPWEQSRKSKWFQAARREMPKSKSGFFCCEDHFDLEQDMENYMRYKMMGGNILLKRNVVPHIFNQDNRKRTADSSETTEIKKQRTQTTETVCESKLLCFADSTSSVSKIKLENTSDTANEVKEQSAQRKSAKRVNKIANLGKNTNEVETTLSSEDKNQSIQVESENCSTSTTCD